MPLTEQQIADLQKNHDTLQAQLKAEQDKTAALAQEVQGKTIAYQRVQKERDGAQGQLQQLGPAYQDLQTRWNTYSQRLNQDPYGVIADIQEEAKKAGIAPQNGRIGMNPTPGLQGDPNSEEPPYVQQIREQNNALARMLKEQNQVVQNLHFQQQQLTGNLGLFQEQTVREKFNAELDQQFAARQFRFKTPQARQMVYDNIWNRGTARKINPATGEPFQIRDGIAEVTTGFLSAPDEAAEKAKADEAAKQAAARANQDFFSSPASGQDMVGEIPEEWNPETEDDIHAMYDKVEQSVAATIQAAPQQSAGDV